MDLQDNFLSIASPQRGSRTKKLSITSGALAIGLAAAILPAHSQEGWVSMKEVETSVQPGDSNLVRIWKDVMDKEAAKVRADGGQIYLKGKPTTLPPGGYPPESFLWAHLEGSSATYVVSIMLQPEPACDNGANSATATQAPPICPVRVTVVPKDGSPSTTKEMDGACGVFPSLWDAPSRGTGTFIRLSGDQIALQATDAGSALPGCSISIPLT